MADVHVRALLDAPVTTEALFAWVGDLASYPAWLDIVRSAEPLPPGPEGQPAWDVVLQARVGPFRRSKRLRMERTGVEEGRWARFERREADGRQHARWSLEAHLDELRGAGGGATTAGAGGADTSAGAGGGATGTRLLMDLRYDGALWSPPLEYLLTHQIEQGKPRLASLAQGRP
jgi:hypothetical protein